MRKIFTKYILILSWKMFESMFFPDSEHVGIRVMLPQKLGISTERGGMGGESLIGRITSRSPLKNIPDFFKQS